MQRIRMNGAILPRPLYVFMLQTLTSTLTPQSPQKYVASSVIHRFLHIKSSVQSVQEALEFSNAIYISVLNFYGLDCPQIKTLLISIVILHTPSLHFPLRLSSQRQNNTARNGTYSCVERSGGTIVLNGLVNCRIHVSNAGFHVKGNNFVKTENFLQHTKTTHSSRSLSNI